MTQNQKRAARALFKAAKRIDHGIDATACVALADALRKDAGARDVSRTPITVTARVTLRCADVSLALQLYPSDIKYTHAPPA